MDRRSANAPAPGAKPTKAKKASAPATEVAATDDRVYDITTGVDETAVSEGTKEQPAPKSGGGAAQANSANQAANRSPRPGARPKKRKR